MKEYYRIMALDIGSVRIGIALSDLMQTIATPYQSYKRQSAAKDLAYLQQIIKKQEVQKIVCGLPVSLNQTENSQAKYCRDFAEKLQNASNLPVEFIDEKLTSVEAEQLLISKNIPPKDRKQLIDSYAAAIILNDYLKENNIMKEKTTQDELFDEIEGDIVELETEDGEVVPFEHICTIEHKGVDYYFFSPLEDNSEIDDEEYEEIVIFTVEEQGEEMVYHLVEDEELIDELFAEYDAIMEEDGDDDDSDDDGDDDDGGCGPKGCHIGGCKGCGK